MEWYIEKKESFSEEYAHLCGLPIHCERVLFYFPTILFDKFKKVVSNFE